MRVRREGLAVVAFSSVVLAAGCGKKDEVPASSNTVPAPASTAPARTAAAQTAAASPTAEKITPAAKPPFESLMFKDTGKKGANGWPKFEAYNVSNKTVTFAAIYAYAYDKGGKLVARTATPLSWNSTLKPGTKADWDVEVGRGEAKPVPAEAVTFELCYNSVKFDGEAKGTDDSKLCGDKRPKGGK